MGQMTVREAKTPYNAIPKRRKLTLSDVQDIASKIVSSRLNETEACYSLGINPKQWFDFKQRHKNQSQFDAIIDTIRAAQLENCVQTINSHGDGVEYTVLNKDGEVVTLTKPGDWRAKAWIAERVLAPERLADRQQQPTQVNVQVFAQIDAVLSKVYAEPRQQVIDVKEVKQLPSGTPTSSPSGKEQH